MKGIYFLVIAALLPLAGRSSAADKELTEVEIKRMELVAKVLLADLVAAKVWDAKSPAGKASPPSEAAKQFDEKTVLKEFKMYEPKAKIKVPRYDEKRDDFDEKDTFTVTGAEYRHALVCYLAFEHYDKLDEDGKKLVNEELFGQESVPTGAKYNAGIDRWKHFAYIVTGVMYSRTGKPAPADKKRPEKQLTDADIEKMESATKDLVKDLLDAGIWTKTGDEYREFMKYKADAVIPIQVDLLKRVLLSQKPEVIFIDGAEYRRALALNAAFTPGNYDKLDDRAKRRANKEVFGQEKRPEGGTDAYKAGVETINRVLLIIRNMRDQSFATASAGPEADANSHKELTEAEVQKMESTTKALFADLVAAKVWDEKRSVLDAFEGINLREGSKAKALDEKVFAAFKKYDPGARVKIARFDAKSKRFNERDTYTVTGAEYRHALVCYDAFFNNEKLGKDAWNRLKMEFFGQESVPKEAAKYQVGIDRLEQFADIVLGEAWSRPRK